MAYNYFDMNQPGRPDYNQAYDPATMSMLPEIAKMLEAIQMDKRGLEKFRGEALREGPSAWAKLAQQKQALEEKDARERGGREQATRAAEARANLAMRGGLTSGARERVAKAGMKDYLDMSQEVGRQGGLNRLQIGMNDEQNRIQQLGMLPGMEAAALQPELEKTRLHGQARQYDIEQAVKEKQARNAWAMDQYKEQMSAWAANRQARATENAGKK